MDYFKTVMEWLQKHQPVKEENRVPFSLKSFSEIFHRKIALWGTGLEANRVIEKYRIPLREDTFFVDNDSQKHEKEFMGKIIKSPETLLNESDTLVVIVSSYYQEIIEQIKEQNLCTQDRIINIYDYEKYGIWD